MTCERCGKKHLGAFVWLELNACTGRYHKPGEVPQAESQGLFRFGPACANAVLKAAGTNQRVRAGARA